MSNIGVIGAGSWGTALATVVADKGNQVRIFDVDEKHLQIHGRAQRKCRLSSRRSSE